MRTLVLVFISIQLISCTTVQKGGLQRSTAAVGTSTCTVAHATILQLNDVYEIQGTMGGKLGGLDRVATVLKDLKRDNPNTFTVLSGDFLSPTALNTARVDPTDLERIIGNKRFVKPSKPGSGKIKLSGRAMTHTLNSIPVDLVTFGNHEFDIDKDEIEFNISESDYKWVTSNVFEADGVTQWPKSEKGNNYIYRFAQDSEPSCVATVGFVGTTIITPKAHVKMTDPIKSLKTDAKALRSKVNALIALTHLTIQQDKEVAQEIPELDLIIGGHDHNNMDVRTDDKGNPITPITKADSNAKTVYVHDLEWNFQTQKLKIKSVLIPINEKITGDPIVRGVIETWLNLAFDAFKGEGFDPNAVVGILKEDLEGRENFVRGGPTKLVTEVSKSFVNSEPGIEAAIVNSGLVRIDDIIPAGPLTQFDIIRIMPSPDLVKVGDLSGKTLQDLFEGKEQISGGNYLDVFPLTKSGRDILIGGVPLDVTRTYRVAVTETLFKILNRFGIKEVPSAGREARQILKEHLTKTLR